MDNFRSQLSFLIHSGNSAKLSQASLIDGPDDAALAQRRVSSGYPTLDELDHKVQVQPGKELTWESLDALETSILHTLKINF